MGGYAFAYGEGTPLEHTPLSTNEEPLIDTRAAARLLGLAEITLRMWRTEGNPDQPPYIRVGSKAVRYRPSAVAAWAASRECQPSKRTPRKSHDPGRRKGDRGRG
jgi:predicted DNA-binding transcriptional regulator AlpA